MLLTLQACWILLFWAALLVAEVAALHVLTTPKHAQPLSRRAAFKGSASRAATAAAVAAATSAMLLVGTRADAAKPDSKDSYDKFAAKYDQLDGGTLAEGLGLEQLRRSMTATAAGRVLEIAVGTGLNLPNYNRAKITKLDCIDLSSAMLQQVISTYTCKVLNYFAASIDSNSSCV
jgi:predicted TPR repeat methyltransferase